MPKRKMVPVIVMMGGGSYGWSPMLMNDILQVQGLEEAEIRVLDINAEAAELMSRLLGMMAQRRGRAITVKATDNQREAFRNADFVVITISTGGLDASEEDMAIPERYGIYQTVGDTVGPGGWSRSIRNIPVLQRVAKDLKELSPQAVILNYTNPMGTLTKALCVESNLRCVGLCHGLFEVYALLQDVFDLESESEIRLNVAGMNHFFWVLDFTIKGEPGYPLLQKKLKGKANFAELVGGDYQYNIYADRRTRTDRKKGPSAEANSYWVCGELLKEYGRLPYIGDRHTVEFLSRYLAPDEARLNASNVKRTPISERVEGMAKAKEQTVAMVEGKEPLPEDRSREAAADIMSAIVHSTEFVDVVNLPNVGQIDNLPRGAVVETLGVINGLGFTPLTAGPLPEPIVNLVYPHASSQLMLVEAVLTGNREQAFDALRNEPVCSHLSFREIRQMGEELLAANKRLGQPSPLG